MSMSRFAVRPRAWLMAASLLFALPAFAEPDPDGEPAGAVAIAVEAASQPALGYKVSAVKAQLYRASNGEHYVRVDYKVHNTGSGTLKSHYWRLTLEAQSVGGETAGDVAPGASRTFSKMIAGRRLKTVALHPIVNLSVSYAGNSGNCIGPSIGVQMDQCNALVAFKNANGMCNVECWGKDQGITGTQPDCVQSIDHKTNCPIAVMPDCVCSGGLGDAIPNSASRMGDLMNGRPQFGTDPAWFRVFNIP